MNPTDQAAVNLSVDIGTINLDQPGYSPKEYAARQQALRLKQKTELCHRGQRLAPNYAEQGNRSFTQSWIDTTLSACRAAKLQPASSFDPGALGQRAAERFCYVAGPNQIAMHQRPGENQRYFQEKAFNATVQACQDAQAPIPPGLTERR